MTSSSSRQARESCAALDLSLLKSWDFSAWEATHGRGHLPYHIDYLERRGIRLHWTDSPHSSDWLGTRRAAMIRRAESAVVPFLQTIIMARAIHRCDATLAMFESEANFLAALRNLVRRDRRKPFVIISCWLAHILASATRRRLAEYRMVYRSVDRLYYFSKNQQPILEEILPAHRLRYLAFGVDTEEFVPDNEPEGGYVLAVGRDSARDWPTFFDAAGQLDMPVKVCCRLSQISGLTVPPNVEILGHVERQVYRELLGRATAVAVVTRPVAYPSGQSVLLEAMAMARPVVVTSTPSLVDYLQDGVDCLAVPPRDSAALRDALERLTQDDQLCATLGANGRRTVEARYNSRSMWDSVADDLLVLTGASQ